MCTCGAQRNHRSTFGRTRLGAALQCPYRDTHQPRDCCIRHRFPPVTWPAGTCKEMDVYVLYELVYRVRHILKYMHAYGSRPVFTSGKAVKRKHARKLTFYMYRRRKGISSLDRAVASRIQYQHVLEIDGQRLRSIRCAAGSIAGVTCWNHDTRVDRDRGESEPGIWIGPVPVTVHAAA